MPEIWGILLAAGCGRRFGAAWRKALLELDANRGAGGLLDQQRAQLELMEVDDAGILRDVDRQEDLTRAPTRGS